MPNDNGNAALKNLPFTFPPNYQPSQFKYGKNGPWPSQPTDGNAAKIAPEVLMNPVEGPNQYPFIPNEEMADWVRDLKPYYDSNTIFDIPGAISYAAAALGVTAPDAATEVGLGILVMAAIFSETIDEEWRAEFDKMFAQSTGYYRPLDDTLFTKLVAHGLLSKLLCTLDPPDRETFKGYVDDNSREYWKNDATHMRAVMTPNDGEYLAPAIVLLSRPIPGDNNQDAFDDFRVEAIALYGQSAPGKVYNMEADVFSPADGKSWELAKYYALQGALVRINLIDHPMVHFPSDAVNAITKTSLPMSNLVFQLLWPHFYLSLPVDNAVLEGKRSLLSRTIDMPFSPYPAKGEEIRKVFPFYWDGSGVFAKDDRFWTDHVKAFPAYSFPPEPEVTPSRYNNFLRAFYPPILTFATAVVKSIPSYSGSSEWKEILTWANYVASWVPGFPDEDALTPELLTKILAMTIWNAAIVHSADHYLMNEMFDNNYPLPYVMMTKPPVQADMGASGTASAEVSHAFSTRLCDQLFFVPHNTVTLLDCQYAFESKIPALKAAADSFRAALLNISETMRVKYPEFKILMDYQDSTQRIQQCFGGGVQY